MSDTFAQILVLVSQGDYLVSNHAYDELLNDRISVNDLLQGLPDAEAVEDYPDAGRGPSVLLLQYDQRGAAHTVWGIPKPRLGPAVLITAYRPDPKRWSPDFRQRRA